VILNSAAVGDWDLVCCGHDHKTNIKPVANIKGDTTMLVNPGTVGGVAAPATYVFGDLENMELWNYITIDGKGVYVGDSLSLYNRPRIDWGGERWIGPWWGEGGARHVCWYESCSPIWQKRKLL